MHRQCQFQADGKQQENVIFASNQTTIRELSLQNLQSETARIPTRICGGQGVNRTLDTRIFSPLLYRLSYLPTVIGRVLAMRSG